MKVDRQTRKPDAEMRSDKKINNKNLKKRREKSGGWKHESI
jgi:hypothetical protein